MIINVVITIGLIFIFLSGLGVLRMPDLFSRMQAASKASTIGCIIMVTAVAIKAGTIEVALRALLIIVFLSITAPLAAHVIARAGYKSGERMRDEDAADDMARDSQE